METRPHSHPCGVCRKDVDCYAARTGGCPFPHSPATCNPCAVLVCGGTPEEARTRRHLCECTAPDPPRDGAVCASCGCFVILGYEQDRDLDMTTLGDAPRKC